MKTMTTHAKLVSAAARKRKVTIKEADEIVKAYFEELSAALNETGKVRIHGFGTFSINHRPERTVRNPRTGEPVKAAPVKGIKFQASETLKREINSCEN